MMKINALTLAVIIAARNSTISSTYRGFGTYWSEDPRRDMHAHRNDINRHGAPVRKKKGKPKMKTRLK